MQDSRVECAPSRRPKNSHKRKRIKIDEIAKKEAQAERLIKYFKED